MRFVQASYPGSTAVSGNSEQEKPFSSFDLLLGIVE
jgi:hypothetical protein